MNRNFSIGLVSFMSLILTTACGSAQTPGNASNVTATSVGTLLQQTRERGTLEIGTEGTYPPFTFHNKQNQLTGFDVELAKAVANKIGVHAHFVEAPRSELLMGLNNKRYDMVASEAQVTTFGIQRYSYSAPYRSFGTMQNATHIAFVFRKDNPELIKEVNGALAELQQDGTYKRMSDKWFGRQTQQKKG